MPEWPIWGEDRDGAHVNGCITDKWLAVAGPSPALTLWHCTTPWCLNTVLGQSPNWLKLSFSHPNKVETQTDIKSWHYGSQGKNQHPSSDSGYSASHPTPFHVPGKAVEDSKCSDYCYPLGKPRWSSCSLQSESHHSHLGSKLVDGKYFFLFCSFLLCYSAFQTNKINPFKI